MAGAAASGTAAAATHDGAKLPRRTTSTSPGGARSSTARKTASGRPVMPTCRTCGSARQRRTAAPRLRRTRAAAACLARLLQRLQGCQFCSRRRWSACNTNARTRGAGGSEPASRTRQRLVDDLLHGHKLYVVALDNVNVVDAQPRQALLRRAAVSANRAARCALDARACTLRVTRSALKSNTSLP